MSDKDKEVHKEKRTYKVQIDKTHYELENATPTARELLVIAGKQPPENFALYFKPHSGAPVRIAIDEKADLREPGVERFVTLPLDQTEGLGEGRREFDLPAEDAEWLEACGMRYELVNDGAVPRVVLHDFPVPAGYNADAVSVNVRIEPAPTGGSAACPLLCERRPSLGTDEGERAAGSHPDAGGVRQP